MITIVNQGFEIFTPDEFFPMMVKIVERAGRVCYKSESKINEDSAEKFISSLVKHGHESVLEHGVITVKFTCDRAFSHQLVRHRIGAYSQESQRYCDYNRLGFSAICPTEIGLVPGDYSLGDDGNWSCIYFNDGASGFNVGVFESKAVNWLNSLNNAFNAYNQLRGLGIKPEDARSVLPNATKTEIVATYNFRQWRHIIKERGFNDHSQEPIRELVLEVMRTFATKIPCIFGDFLVRTK